MSNEKMEATLAIAKAMTAVTETIKIVSKSKHLPQSDKVLSDMSEAMTAMNKAMITASESAPTHDPAPTPTSTYDPSHAPAPTSTYDPSHAPTLEHAPAHTHASTTPNTSVLCLKKELEQANMKTLYRLRTEPAHILEYFGKEWKAITEAFSEICEHNKLESRDQNEFLKPEEKKRFELLSKTHSLNSKIIVLWSKNNCLSSSLLDEMLKNKKLDEEVKEVEKYKLSAEEVEAVNLLGRNCS